VGLNNTMTGLILADSMLAIPFVIVTVGSGLAGADSDLERAARNLGASRLRAFLTVTAPQIKLSILSGALFAFVTAFDEVVVALFISGGSGSTLTRRIFTSIRDEVDPTVAAVSSIMVTLSVVVLIGVQMLRRDDQR
jgi:putative spermidine/putrescine transport system permease protein